MKWMLYILIIPFQYFVREGITTCGKLLVAWQLVESRECCRNLVLSSMLVLCFSIQLCWRLKKFNVKHHYETKRKKSSWVLLCGPHSHTASLNLHTVIKTLRTRDLKLLSGQYFSFTTLKVTLPQLQLMIVNIRSARHQNASIIVGSADAVVWLSTPSQIP